MPQSTRFSIARRLFDLGLRKTLVAIKKSGGYDVSRISMRDDSVKLTPVGKFLADHVPVIGRVGVPDPQLGVLCKDSMHFYGKWFDDIGETDPGYRLRKNISSLSESRMLEQIERDDQYALIGSYCSVFNKIMDVKNRVPLVFIDSVYLPLGSFPVILPELEDRDSEETMMAVLRRMLRLDLSATGDAESRLAATGGIEVDEISADEIARIPPQDRTCPGW